MGLKRLRFFKYFFTGAHDWQKEQDYHKGRADRHQVRVHGWGIVDGLRVQPTGPPSLSIVVPAGMAVDHNGQDIFVEADQVIDLTSAVPNTGTAIVYIAVKSGEQKTDPVFVAELGTEQYTAIEETATLEVLASPPASPSLEAGRILLGQGATQIKAPIEPANPGVNEIDLRYVRTLGGGATEKRSKEQIAEHKHNGAPGSPQKVVLTNGQEVDGKLPGGMVDGKVPSADTIDGIHASSTPERGKLLPLGENKKFPVEVLPTGHGNGIDSDTVDGAHAFDTPESRSLLILDARGKIPNAALYEGHGGGIDADKLDGKEGSYYAPAIHGHANATTLNDGFMSATDKAKLDGMIDTPYQSSGSAKDGDYVSLTGYLDTPKVLVSSLTLPCYDPAFNVIQQQKVWADEITKDGFRVYSRLVAVGNKTTHNIGARLNSPGQSWSSAISGVNTTQIRLRITTRKNFQVQPRRSNGAAQRWEIWRRPENGTWVLYGSFPHEIVRWNGSWVNVDTYDLFHPFEYSLDFPPGRYEIKVVYVNEWDPTDIGGGYQFWDNCYIDVNWWEETSDIVIQKGTASYISIGSTAI